MTPSSESTIRVALVEDEREEREGLAYLLNRTVGFACVAACASAEEALTIIPACHPEVVLMDIHLPGMSGIDCVRELKARLPNAQVMMLTVFEDYTRIFQALRAGASGYLLKKTPPAKLLEAIQELHAGGAPMSGQIARQVVEAFQGPVSSPSGGAKLSATEEKVLQLLARGLLYKEVADELEIKMSTVRTHIGRIYKKLHARNRTEAIQKGFPHRQA